MAESEVHRRAKVLRAAGVGEQDVELVSQAWRCIFAIAAAGRANPDDAATLSRLTAAVAAAVGLAEVEVPEYARQNPMLSPIPPQIAADDLVGMVGGVGDPELDHDPAADYAKVRCPVVLIWGEHDTSIPVNVSRLRIGEALDKAGNGQVSLVVLPGLDHLLNVPRGDVVGLSPEEAMNLLAGFRFGPGARGLLGRSLAGLLHR
jgi:pimeloyl-ACP methyl ester carboxylesterase